MPAADQPLADDGLATPDINEWSELKHDLLTQYAGMFSTSMQDKWDCRVCIDLFASAGRGRIKGSGKIVQGSPLLALGLPFPFDHYVFCEKEEALLQALEARVQREFPSAQVDFIQGDANDRVAEILGKLPRASRGRCGHRNVATYVNSTDCSLDTFLGTRTWRDGWPWPKKEHLSRTFGDYLADFFGRQMRALGFKYEDGRDLMLVRQPDNNSPLYHLGIFTRHALGRVFWRKARDSADPQMKLF